MMNDTAPTPDATDDHGGELRRLAAFTTTADGGNPAGVWIGDAFPDDAQMQAIAADVGYSETAFAVRRAPARDAPFATSARWRRSRSAATRPSPWVSRSEPDTATARPTAWRHRPGRWDCRSTARHLARSQH